MDDALLRGAWNIALWGAVGFGVCGTVMLGLGLAGMIVGWFLWVVTGLLAISLLIYVARSRRSRPQLNLSWVEVACGAVMLGGGVVLLAMALYPDIEIDDYAYHFSVPKAWVNEGRIFNVPFEVHSNLHFLSEMSYLWGFALVPDQVLTPKLLETSRCLLAVLAAVGCCGALYGRRAGFVTGALLVCYEEFSRYGTTGHVDAGQSLYIIAGAGCLAAWLENPSRRAALVTGSLLFGFASAVKQTGYAATCVGLGAAGLMRLAERCRARETRGVGQELVLLTVPGLLAIAPWIAKSALFTGDPFFPFLWKYFPLNDFTSIGMIYLRDYYPTHGEIRVSGLLPEMHQVHAIVSNVRLGHVNGLLLLAPWALQFFILNRRREREYYSSRFYLVLVPVILAPMFLKLPFGRFFAGIYPLALIAWVGESWLFFGRFRRPWPRLIYFGAAILMCGSAFFNVQRFGGTIKVLVYPPVSPALTSTRAEAFYRQHIRHYDMILRVNERLGPGDRLLASLATETLPLLNVRFLPNAPVVSQEGIQAMDDNGFTAEEMAEFLADCGVTHILTAENFNTAERQAFADAYLVEIERDDDGARLYLFTGP